MQAQLDEESVERILGLVEVANRRELARRRRRFRRRMFVVLAAVVALCAAAAVWFAFDSGGKQASKSSPGTSTAADHSQTPRTIPNFVWVPAKRAAHYRIEFLRRHPRRLRGEDDGSETPRGGRATPAGPLSLAGLGARQVGCARREPARRRVRDHPLIRKPARAVQERAGRPSSAATREAGPGCRTPFPRPQRGAGWDAMRHPREPCLVVRILTLGTSCLSTGRTCAESLDLVINLGDGLQSSFIDVSLTRSDRTKRRRLLSTGPGRRIAQAAHVSRADLHDRIGLAEASPRAAGALLPRAPLMVAPTPRKDKTARETLASDFLLARDRYG